MDYSTSSLQQGGDVAQHPDGGDEAPPIPADAIAPETATDPDNQGNREGIVMRSRRDLLERIVDFILANDLDVTSENLAFAHAALSGSNGGLAEELAARQYSGAPVDQHWVDQIIRVCGGPPQPDMSVEGLMDTFEQSLFSFLKTTRSARKTTGEYCDEFDREISKIDTVGSESDLQPLLHISHAMIGQMRHLRDEMQRSQSEAHQLRKRLSEARLEADVDYLTGLPNRRAFERRMSEAAEKTILAGGTLSIAFCDVDRFKSINDTHGHEAGDRVLQAIAKTLNEIADQNCFVARHGGEEFALLFDGSGRDEAWRKLEYARRVLETRRFKNRKSDKPFGRITFSAGLAEMEAKDEPHEVLMRADAALYHAKENGRNRVVAG